MKAIKAISRNDLILFYSYGLISIISILLGFYFDQKALLVLPFAVPIIMLAVVNFRALYFLLLACIPLSTEFAVSASMGTDLPTEPLMVGLMLVLIIYLVRHAARIDFSFFRNAIMIMLFLHLAWLFVSIISSTVPLFSIKFFLAKMWYVGAFVLATSVVIRTEKDVKTMFWVVFIPLTFTIITALIRHSFIGFSFDNVNSVLTPFYRNHVNYAAIVAIFIPFVFYARGWYPKGTWTRFLLTVSVPLFVIAVYLSYTRASYLALIAIFFAYFIFRWNLTKWAILGAFIAIAGLISFITYENHYLKYSPTTNTVSQHEFGDLVDATFKAEDVSSMERIYRWIAAVHMVKEKPIMGFGANGFVSNYKNYTVFIFETWISDNEEQSGVHNYFLMTLVEQGIVGLIIFIGLLCAIFLYAQQQYLKHKHTWKGKWLMALSLSMVAILVNLVFSDMIEVDKSGSFFFMNLAMIVLVSRDFKGLVAKDLSTSE